MSGGKVTDTKGKPPGEGVVIVFSCVRLCVYFFHNPLDLGVKGKLRVAARSGGLHFSCFSYYMIVLVVVVVVVVVMVVVGR